MVCEKVHTIHGYRSQQKVAHELGIRRNIERPGKQPIKAEIIQPKSMKKEGALKDYSMDKLNELLKEAIDNEDYEKAANIRDELNRRN